MLFDNVSNSMAFYIYEWTYVHIELEAKIAVMCFSYSHHTYMPIWYIALKVEQWKI